MRRRLLRLRERAGLLLGDLACLALLVLLLPLVPVFKMFDGIRDLHDE